MNPHKSFWHAASTNRKTDDIKMGNLTVHQRYLLLGKVSKTLNDEESEEWDQMLEQVPEVAAAYEQFTRRLPADKVASGFSYVDEPGYWDDLAVTLKGKPVAPGRLLPWWRSRWTAAAAFAGIVATSALLWSQFSPKDTLVASQKPSVELQLADGSAINLSQRKGSIKTGTASLNNTNNTLTYTAGNNTRSTAINTLRVPTGLDYKILLADGTEVWMNSATELKFPLAFPGNTREITIDGEAFLKISKNAQKPFIVHLPHSTVQVLGTAFNVNTYDSAVETVSLVEGSVNLHTVVGDTRLEPGTQAVFSHGRVQEKTFNPKYVLGWREGLFYFDETTLPEISQAIERWFGMQVMIDNPAIRDKKFAGVLDRKQPISVFQNDLKLISGIDSYIDQNKVLHFK